METLIIIASAVATFFLFKGIIWLTPKIRDYFFPFNEEKKYVQDSFSEGKEPLNDEKQYVRDFFSEGKEPLLTINIDDFKEEVKKHPNRINPSVDLLEDKVVVEWKMSKRLDMLILMYYDDAYRKHLPVDHDFSEIVFMSTFHIMHKIWRCHVAAKKNNPHYSSVHFFYETTALETTIIFGALGSILSQKMPASLHYELKNFLLNFYDNILIKDPSVST